MTYSLHFSRNTLLSKIDKLLDILQRSTIANPEITDPIQRFWRDYKRTADEVDNELLEKYSKDLESAMILVM